MRVLTRTTKHKNNNNSNISDYVCSHKIKQASQQRNKQIKNIKKNKSSEMKFITSTCSTSILLLAILAMISTMSGTGKAVEARVGGDEGRNLHRNRHNCVGDGGYEWCATKSKCLRTFEEDCPSGGGGDVDVHGCRASAGYTWCKSKGSCIRSFDEDCPTNPGQQCGRRCTTTYDCSSNAGIWDTGHAWCGAECSGGRCHPKYQDCKRNSDCDQTKAVCGRQGYCVGR